MDNQLFVLLKKIKEIMNAVTIPVMAKTRIGHFAEAQILEALGVDMVDESEGKSITFYLESASNNCKGGFHFLFFIINVKTLM